MFSVNTICQLIVSKATFSSAASVSCLGKEIRGEGCNMQRFLLMPHYLWGGAKGGWDKGLLLSTFEHCFWIIDFQVIFSFSKIFYL